MEYSIQELSRLSGVTTRTLRWYDEIGLLKPCRVAKSGYRYYGAAEVDRLRDILYYRALGVDLKRIKACLDAPSFNRLQALHEHLSALRSEQERLERLISSVQNAIDAEERDECMSDEKKFEAFKKQKIDENERRYGKEARQRYGDREVDASNAKLMELTKAQYGEWEQLDEEIRNRLETAVKGAAKPSDDAAREIVEMHRKWLTISMRSCDAARHRGIAQLYVLDERFTAYYDRNVEGCAQFLRDAVMCWVK